MISKAIRAAAVLLTTLAIPAAVLAAPLPARAATTICEDHAPYCLYAANFSNYTAVTEAISGRDIDAVLQNGEYQGHKLYLLQFHYATGECVAANNAGTKVETKACSGSTGVIWARVENSSYDEWINQAASENANKDQYLSGLDCSGCQFELHVEGYNGTYQKFFISS
jgi:hypothetical protein